MTQLHPGEPRDVDLDAWLNGFGFHPANTKVKQLGHQLARRAVASLAQLFFWLLPAGREKSLAFSHLEQALMFANKALAVGGGAPLIGGDERYTEDALEAALREFAHVQLPDDPRIRQYEAEQLKTRPTMRGAEDDAPTSAVTGVAVQQAAEARIYQEVETAPDDRFEMELLSSRPDEVDLKVVASPGAVQIASLARAVDRKKAAIEGLVAGADTLDARDLPDGFYAVLSTPAAVNQFLSAVAAAGDRAFR